MSFPKDFYDHLAMHNYVEIKGGLNRNTFLEIWMVSVNKQIFARSWNKSEKSWFTAFIDTGLGQLKYGNKVISVKGKKLPKDSNMHPLINEAYRNRYNETENIFYSIGIGQPEYANYTMEFFYSDELNNPKINR